MLSIGACNLINLTNILVMTITNFHENYKAFFNLENPCIICWIIFRSYFWGCNYQVSSPIFLDFTGESIPSILTFPAFAIPFTEIDFAGNSVQITYKSFPF